MSHPATRCQQTTTATSTASRKECGYSFSSHIVVSATPDPISGQDEALAKATPHGRFYLETGDIVFQVQKTVFKVHRHFMAKISSAIQDMLDLPQPRKETLEASGMSTPDTEHSEKPLFVLRDESASGWEHILSIFYRE
ncbi:hypothetical protein FRC17_006470 [Serendipita sp. 399]|nr:hypothetical protein FRC17_006470 [Serendipita sp. 399]